MFHTKLLCALSRLGLVAGRPDVLIFGASGGGQAQFDRIGTNHNVIGFVDNNPRKHGSICRQRPVYSPQQIHTLRFDRIIVASCYHEEIVHQLVQDLEVAPERVSVFDVDDTPAPAVLSRTRAFVDRQFFQMILDTRSELVAKFGFRIARGVDRTYRSIDLTPISRPDESIGYRESVLAPESSVTVHGPKFIGRPQAKSEILAPAIRMTCYRDAMISCTSNSFLCDGKLSLWRSPTSMNDHSDYSSGYVLRHGRRYALTDSIGTADVGRIERGVAITGSVDVNYYHWMLEIISKLFYVDLLDEVYADYPLLMSEKAREIEAVSSFIDHLGMNRDVMYLRSDGYYQVDDLVTITPPNFAVINFSGRPFYEVTDSYFTSASLRFVRDTALDYATGCGVRTGFSEKIFLARKGLLRAYNQNEVWELLKERGFEAIHMEDLSFAEQVFAMQHASVIAGPTGAAWTNLLFCEPGTRALCWMAEESGNFSCFSQIAAEMEVDLEYLSYKTGFRNTREVCFGGYNIDIGQIEGWLDSICLSGSGPSSSVAGESFRPIEIAEDRVSQVPGSL